MGEIDKKYVRNMLLEYMLELVRRENFTEANYVAISIEHLTNTIYERVFEPNNMFGIEKNGEYSVANIDWYEMGGYFNTNCITIFKDSKFFTNIL